MADAPAPHHALVMPFVAALLQRTLGCPTVAAHQHALQGFLDDLTPWMNPVAYLLVADNVSGPLLTRLIDPSQPVIHTGNEFSRPRLALLARI